jgi:hypothetical protein
MKSPGDTGAGKADSAALSGTSDAHLEALGSDGPDDLPADAGPDELSRARGDAADEHRFFTVDPDDPREDEGGSLMPRDEPV